MTKDNILDQKVGKLSLLDGALIGVSKLGSEEVMSRVPFVGNGTVRSGLVKTGTAVVGAMVAGQLKGGVEKASKIFLSGMLIDGMEDLFLVAKKQILGSPQNATGEMAAF